MQPRAATPLQEAMYAAKATQQTVTAECSGWSSRETWLGWRDSVTFRDPATSRLTINRHRKIALKLPLAVFTPECPLGEFKLLLQPRKNPTKMSGLCVAGVLDVCSNHCIANFNPVQLRKLAIPGDRATGSSKVASYRAQALEKRLEPESIADLVCRSGAGESARSLAKEYEVAPSALVRLLREHGVVVTKRKVTDAEAQLLAQEYKNGATMRELEKQFKLSHGAVLRALHRVGVEMRARAPRKQSR